MPDVEVLELARSRHVDEVDVLDEAIHLLADGVIDLVHVLVRTFHNQFNAAIRKILDIAVDVIALSNILNGIPEPDPLYAAAETAFPAVSGIADDRVLVSP
jgi:hypothetical protein